jgi:hypothetical protein
LKRLPRTGRRASLKEHFMARIITIGLTCAVALAGAMTATSAEAGCRRAGGEATMITKDLAVFMAKSGLLAVPIASASARRQCPFAWHEPRTA